MDLEEVPSLGRLLACSRRSLFGRVDGVAAERRTGEVEVGRHDLAPRRALLELELPREAEHAAHGRDAVRDVEEENGLDVMRRRLRRGNVAVHLG
jgi:hypothetical protein